SNPRPGWPLERARIKGGVQSGESTGGGTGVQARPRMQSYHSYHHSWTPIYGTMGESDTARCVPPLKPRRACHSRGRLLTINAVCAGAKPSAPPVPVSNLALTQVLSDFSIRINKGNCAVTASGNAGP